MGLVLAEGNGRTLREKHLVIEGRADQQPVIAQQAKDRIARPTLGSAPIRPISVFCACLPVGRFHTHPYRIAYLSKRTH